MKCPHCGHEFNLGAIVGKLGKGHKKTMTPAAMEARKAASAKGVAARQAKAKERREKGEVSIAGMP